MRNCSGKESYFGSRGLLGRLLDLSRLSVPPVDPDPGLTLLQLRER